MEDFATQVAEAGTAESIAQVFDQYLNFIVSERDLFSLGMGKDTYWALNSSKTTDEELDAVVSRIVSGLFSVVVTMGEQSRDWMRLSAHVRSRGHTNHSLSKRRGGRNGRCKA